MHLDKNQTDLHTHFQNTHWLSNQKHTEQFLLWNTFYRRNLHRFAQDYLGLSLHLYQLIWLYLMGISSFICVIASRGAAKSYIIAIYSCCKAILYPGSMIVLTSGTRGQSKLIVTRKIQQELMGRSKNLCREIDKVIDNQNEVIVHFKNGSSVETVTCSKNARGHRSTVNVGEEAREIDKNVMDTVISPFKFVRQVPFMVLQEYAEKEEFKEEPTTIYISSSIEESHWLYKIAKNARDGMLNGDGAYILTMDYSITLKHGIKTKKDLITERRDIDPITWKIEYENAVLRSNARAFFLYDMIKANQVLKRAFYPKSADAFIAKRRNKYNVEKLPGEMRIVTCDIAMVDKPENDNSVFSCLRLLPETIEDDDAHTRQDFRIQVPYLEGIRGCETKKQAIRISQLFYDFEADFIVMDTRSAGVPVYDCLARALYDDERGVEYPPLTCMNNENYAKRIINPNANPIIYAINGTTAINSAMAYNLRSMFVGRLIDLLVPKDEGIDEIIAHIPEYSKGCSAEDQLFYEKPYLETMLLISELIGLESEKIGDTNLVRLSERTGMMKDRYSSLAMGCFFVAQLSRDILNTDTSDYTESGSCVSEFKW